MLGRAIVISPLVCALAHAASLYTETFESGASGWGSSGAAMAVTNAPGAGNPGAGLRGSYPASFFPLQNAFTATGALASAAFVGDYLAAGAELLGFDMKMNAGGSAPAPRPIHVRLFSGTNYFHRVLQNALANTGTWYRFRLPLIEPSLGGWTNVVGSYGQFAEVLSNVTRAEILVFSDSATSLEYLLDNVFLDRLHKATSISSDSASNRVVWSALRVGDLYRIENSANLESGWTAVSAFTAAASTVEWAVPTTNAHAVLFYRLTLE